MKYLCVVCSRSTQPHISGAPILDHGDDMSQFHLQSERRLPLRLHLNVLPHLSHHRIHTLRETDELSWTNIETLLSVECESPGVLPAYTSAAPEKHRDLLETWV